MSADASPGTSRGAIDVSACAPEAVDAMEESMPPDASSTFTVRESGHGHSASVLALVTRRVSTYARR